MFFRTINTDRPVTFFPDTNTYLLKKDRNKSTFRYAFKNELPLISSAICNQVRPGDLLCIRSWIGLS